MSENEDLRNAMLRFYFILCTIPLAGCSWVKIFIFKNIMNLKE